REGQGRATRQARRGRARRQGCAQAGRAEEELIRSHRRAPRAGMICVTKGRSSGRPSCFRPRLASDGATRTGDVSKMAGKDVPVSPLAPKRQPKVPPVPGVRFATAEAGIRYKGRTDVVLMLLDEGTQAAGVFTRSKCPSAPVDWCRENLKQG